MVNYYSYFLITFLSISSIISSVIQKQSTYLDIVDVTTLYKVLFCQKDPTRLIFLYDESNVEYFLDPFSIGNGVTVNTGITTGLFPTACLGRDDIMYMNSWTDLSKANFANEIMTSTFTMAPFRQCDSSNAEHIPNSQRKVFFNCVFGQTLKFFAYDLNAVMDGNDPIISIDITGYEAAASNFINCAEAILLDGVVCIYGLDDNAYVNLISNQGPKDQTTLQNVLSFFEGTVVLNEADLFIGYYDMNGLQLFHGTVTLDTPSMTASTVITLEPLTSITHISLNQCVKSKTKLWLQVIDYAVILGCVDTASISVYSIQICDLSIKKLQLDGLQNGDYPLLFYDTLSQRAITLSWLQRSSPAMFLYKLIVPYCSNTTLSIENGAEANFAISSVFPVLDNNVPEFMLKEALLIGGIVFQSSNSALVVNQYNQINLNTEVLVYRPQLEGTETILLTGMSIEKMELTCSVQITVTPPTIVNCPQYTITQGNVCINCKDTGTYYYNNQCLPTKPPRTFNVDSNYNAIDYCYLLCQICTAKGTDTVHQCSSCIEGYTLEPLPSTQCLVESCSDYHYYDTNGVKHCTSTCSVDPFLFILYSCKQCLDNCNSPLACESSHSLRYTYAYNCLNKCPMGTTSSNMTLLCDPSVNEDYLIYSYKDIIEWIESVTRNDLIELAKNDSIIINQNYIIDIYITANGKGNSSSTIITDSLNISKLSFEECTKKLKEHYNIPLSDPLIVLKIDLDNSKLLTNQIEYEVYSFDGVKLDLSLCVNTTITIEAGVKNDDQINWELAKNLSLLGVDIFNTRDRFYNDFCFPYTMNQSTDILVEDRRTDIFPNVSLCQENCTYLSINYTVMKVMCDCSVSPQVDPSPKAPSLKDQFIDSFVSSNIEVVTCYKLVFDFKYLRLNIAFWLYLALIFIQVLMVFLYALHDFKSLREDINCRRIRIRGRVPPQASPVKRVKDTKEGNPLNQNSKTRQSIETMNFDVISGNKFIQTKTGTVTTEGDISPNVALWKRSIPAFYPIKANLVPSSAKKDTNDVFTLNSSNLSNPKKRRLTSRFGSIIVQTLPCEGDDGKAKAKDREEEPMVTYEDSLRNDKRSHWRMFWDIFIEKDIIFNTIFELERYQQISLKITTCIFSIALDFSFNALFYSVEIISNSYEKKGVIDFLFSLPKTIYSALASILLMWILSCFSATNWTFRSFEMKGRHVKKFTRSILIKHSVYFTLNFIFMLAFWYFSVAFGVVYYNSQINWLIDSCASTLIGIVISLAVSVSITLFRSASLKYKQKCLFEACKLWQSL